MKKNRIRKWIPKSVLKIRRNAINKNRRNQVPDWCGENRIFCISFQRTGTTSFGDFFEHFGYSRMGWSLSRMNKWTQKVFQDKTDEIFESEDFKLYQVFEDDPWWLPGFYKEVYKRFPNAQFVLIERDSKEWFRSMVSHSKGKNPGNSRIHAWIYNREEEYYDLIKKNKLVESDDYKTDNLLDLNGKETHYIAVYEKHIADVKSFFAEHAPESLLVVQLSDPDKWQKIANFVGIEIPENFDIHSNKSRQ